MKWVFALTFAALAAGAVYSAPISSKPLKSKAAQARTTQTKASQAKLVPAKAVHASAHASVAKSSPHTVALRTHSHASSRYRRARVAPAPSFQLHPDPERYQQIQQALADRGYFKGEVNGVWGDDSVDALQRFQADQKLENDGKINALTLIDLGLGPKHDPASTYKPAPPQASAALSPTNPQ